jgi:1-acyl-sn-glycerol-3-phosphate acyltransferase
VTRQRTTPLRFTPPRESAWHFGTVGRWLLWRAAKALTRGSANATPESRYALQRDWAARILQHLEVDLQIEYATPMPRKPHIVVALHEGMLDPLCLLQLGQPMRFAARREIASWSGVGPAVAAMNHILIDPERGVRAFRQLRRQAELALRQGEHVVVFAQGTVLGIETAFRSGAFELAAALGCDLLPVALAGSHRVWEHPFTPALRYGQSVWMRVLSPVAAPTRNRHATGQIRVAVQHAMQELALRQTHAPVRRYVPARDGYWDGFAFEIDPRFEALHAEIAFRRTMLRSA